MFFNLDPSAPFRKFSVRIKVLCVGSSLCFPFILILSVFVSCILKYSLFLNISTEAFLQNLHSKYKASAAKLENVGSNAIILPNHF